MGCCLRRTQLLGIFEILEVVNSEHGLSMRCVCGAKEKNPTFISIIEKCGKTTNNADTAISDANFRH